MGRDDRTQSPCAPVCQALKAKGNTIGGPAKIRQPANTIPREWPDDLAAAFASRQWEITTAQETFAFVEKGTEVHVQRRFLLGLQSGEFGPGHWLTTGPNQWEWSPDNHDLVASFPLGAVEFLFGATFAPLPLVLMALSTGGYEQRSELPPVSRV